MSCTGHTQLNQEGTGCTNCPENQTSDGMGGCRPILTARFVFDSHITSFDPNNASNSDPFCKNSVFTDPATSIVLKGKDDWKETSDEFPVVYKNRGAYFDTFTFFTVEGLKIPWDGSF
jgi:hypothetical protein